MPALCKYFIQAVNKGTMLSQSYSLKRTSLRNTPLVLVVDDHEDNVIFATGSLELLNFECIIARDGKSAIKMAVDRLPDIILLDVVMPQMDGITVTQILKQNLLTKNIPIVAVTGLAYKYQQQQIIKAGFDDYLCKPYLIEELSDKLDRFFDLEVIGNKKNYNVNCFSSIL